MILSWPPPAEKHFINFSIIFKWTFTNTNLIKAALEFPVAAAYWLISAVCRCCSRGSAQPNTTGHPTSRPVGVRVRSSALLYLTFFLPLVSTVSLQLSFCLTLPCSLCICLTIPCVSCCFLPCLTLPHFVSPSVQSRPTLFIPLLPFLGSKFKGLGLALRLTEAGCSLWQFEGGCVWRHLEIWPSLHATLGMPTRFRFIVSVWSSSTERG